MRNIIWVIYVNNIDIAAGRIKYCFILPIFAVNIPLYRYRWLPVEESPDNVECRTI